MLNVRYGTSLVRYGTTFPDCSFELIFLFFIFAEIIYLNKHNTMTTVKHLFISLLVLFGYTSGAWAIEQDSDGYYLIGSVQDWKDFAAVVATTNIGAGVLAFG